MLHVGRQQRQSPSQAFADAKLPSAASQGQHHQPDAYSYNQDSDQCRNVNCNVVDVDVDNNRHADDVVVDAGQVDREIDEGELDSLQEFVEMEEIVEAEHVSFPVPIFSRLLSL